jgi:hypothetical protein
MKDEIWMRNWNEGHPHFSHDLHRGILWLLTPFRRLGAWIALPSAPGADSVFARVAAHCGMPARRKAR